MKERTTPFVEKRTNTAHPVISDMAVRATAAAQIYHTLIRTQTFTCCFFKRNILRKRIQTERTNNF